MSKGPFHPWVYFTIMGEIKTINQKMQEKYPHAGVVSAVECETDSWGHMTFLVFCRTRDGSKVPDGFEDHV